MFEDQYFKNRKLNQSKLLTYGFKEVSDLYQYSTTILDGTFILNIMIDFSGNVYTEMLEPDTGEEYTLYKAVNAAGSFVGNARSDCEKALKDIAEKCYDPDVFKTRQAAELIEYVRNRYGDELEFLWTRFPDNVIWRRKDNKKWYGAILTVSKEKLGLKSHEIAEIIDLRLQPERMEKTVDYKRYFPGWHMNKKTWYTIILDYSVDTEEICKKIDESYQLAMKK